MPSRPMIDTVLKKSKKTEDKDKVGRAGTCRAARASLRLVHRVGPVRIQFTISSI